MRSVAIEQGLCRSGRTRGASGLEACRDFRGAKPQMVEVGRGKKKAPFGDQETIRSNAQTGVVMKAAPPSSFVMSQAKLLFEFFVVAFDDPAMLGQPHQFS